MDFPPAVVKFTLQLPVPPDSVIVQFVFAPVMVTVPVGIVRPTTFTDTVTNWLITEGSGARLVILVMVLLFTSTSWVAVELLAE